MRNAASISTHSPKLEHSTTITGRSKACANGSIDMGITSAVIDKSLPHSGSGMSMKLWLATCRGACRGTADMRCSSALPAIPLLPRFPAAWMHSDIRT